MSNFSIDFIQNHLKLTHKINNFEQLKELNNYTDNFVVGTDQVFRYKYMGKKSLFPIYTLAFTDFNKRRVAFSASFGIDKFSEANFAEKYFFKKCLKRFNNISTREKSGIALCRKNFNIKADDIIDPVFLVDKSYWDELLNTTKADTKEKIVSYILDEDDKTIKIYDFLERKYNTKIENLANSNHSPEYFLSAIKNSKYFVTDSFHGTCFALIFNKKVICLINEKRGESRFKNLAEKFNVDFIFYKNFNEIKNSENLFKNIDYDSFLNKIIQEQTKAKLWIENAFKEKINKKNKSLLIEKIKEQYFQFLFLLYLKNPLKILKNILYQHNLFKKYKTIIKKHSSSKIVFWGASLFLKEFIEKYNIKQENILAIVDKNPINYGKYFGKYEIMPIEKIAVLMPDIVICSIKNHHETIYPIIKEELNKNFPNIKIEKDLFKQD